MDPLFVVVVRCVPAAAATAFSKKLFLSNERTRHETSFLS
jgi:hypothetical protein